jgi:capsular polysaccharide export protein
VNKIEKVEGKRILFLQGPMGCFFRKLDRAFRKQGAVTFRIGFNMGDRLFSYGDNYTPFRGRPEEWEAFISDFLKRHQIDKIFLFGDCRYYQKISREVAYRMGIEVFVFEEGYIRPHYITMERYGVNGFSSLSRDPGFYRAITDPVPDKPEHAHSSKTKMVLSASAYYAVANLGSFRYPHYRHHRDFSAMKELFYGIRGLIRKGIYALTERGYEARISGELSGRYFFVPLQTHNDFQILQHSHYQSVEKFIIEVLESFSRHAPKEDWLVFKHHPVDRGRKKYNRFIMEQAEILGIEDRVLVFHDVYLPTCLRHAKGTVTINSTVGLSSIEHGTPTITMGTAIYDIEGLTNKDTPLDRFWLSPRKPDAELYRKFRYFLIENTQLNGSFYGRMPKEFCKD